MIIDEYFESLDGIILGWEREIYPDKWPKCTVYLTPKQFDIIKTLNNVNLKSLLRNFELSCNKVLQSKEDHGADHCHRHGGHRPSDPALYEAAEQEGGKVRWTR